MATESRHEEKQLDQLQTEFGREHADLSTEYASERNSGESTISRLQNLYDVSRFNINFRVENERFHNLGK